jgi:hypothetical protein
LTDWLEGGTVAPGQILTRILPAGDYTLTYGTGAAARIELPVRVQAGIDSRVILERTAGLPCHFVVEFRGRAAASGTLWAFVRNRVTGDEFDTYFCPAVGDRTWSVGESRWVGAFDLQPGRYELRVLSGWGGEGAWRFEVEAHAQGRSFWFDLR